MSAKELLPLIVFVSIVVLMVSSAVTAYVLSRRGGIVRRYGSWAAAAVWILIALVVTAWLGLPVLLDFQIAAVSSKEVTLESIIIGSICSALWFMAVRRIFQALTNAKSNPDSSIPIYR